MNIGDKAPEILGKDEQGREIRLSDYRATTTTNCKAQATRLSA